jgi:hypothetical protein
MLDEWPSRTEDAAWLENIIQRLETSADVLPEHTQAIRAKPSGARFRPEEVAGSLSEPEFPVTFVRAEALGLEILTELAV